jgi:flavin-dependent dehydrogenase
VILLSSTDVLVVGGGPAGSVAAVLLARRGLRVLLADNLSDKDSYDLLVTGPALQGLAAIGVNLPPEARAVDAIDLRFGSSSQRTISGAGAAICNSLRLRQALREAAEESGALCIRGKVASIARHPDGHLALVSSPSGTVSVSMRPVIARHVVAATGAGGICTPDIPSHARGVSCSQKFTGAWFDGGQAMLVLGSPSTAAPDESPTCVWALPSDDGTVTIGTARTGDSVLPADLVAEALRVLAAADPRFAEIRAVGPMFSGLMNTGFTPERLAQSGVLLAGDAAGLVNPFTGEGLSYAVQSGVVAARVIAANFRNQERARRRYARRLSATFVGYFETARHARRRYHLAWRILAAGADSDHPFFAKGRRAVLLPEGFSGLTAAERVNLARPDSALAGPFLTACDEIAISVVRGEWPFLARLAITGETLGHYRLRPAVPFLAALLADGHKPTAADTGVGAAIELALIGSLAMLGPVPQPSANRGVDWALTSTVLAGDFLLAQASKLVTQSAPEVSWAFSDWLAELTALRALRLTPGSSTPAQAVYASLFEFPARIGAQLGGASDRTTKALRDFGRQAGNTFGYAEDMLSLRGERTRLDTTLAVMLRGRFSGIPDLLGGPRIITEETLASDPLLRARALAAASDACNHSLRLGLKAAGQIADPAAARILRAFIETIAAPLEQEGI